MSKLPNHLFVSDTDGCLYDTRTAGWTMKPPLRRNYMRTNSTIRSFADVKAALRMGQFAWPGGYPMYFLTADGGALSFDGARKNLMSLARDFANQWDVGGLPVAIEINYEDTDLVCEFTNERIPSAYAEDEAVEAETLA